MHCGRVSNLLSAYIDRELAGSEMLQIRRHLDLCPGCSAEHGSLCRVKSLLSGAPSPEPSGDRVTAVMRRWSARRDDLSAPRRGAPSRASHRRWSWPALPPHWHRYGLVAATACLAFTLIATAWALRKPNYPDTLAANVLPLLSEPDERVPVRDLPFLIGLETRLSPPDLPYVTANWTPRERHSERWPGRAGSGASSLLISNSPWSGGPR